MIFYRKGQRGVDKKGNPKDACVISTDYSTADNYYVFNHVDIVIYYHDGHGEDWGKYLSSAEAGGRIVAVKITPRYIILWAVKELCITIESTNFSDPSHTTTIRVATLKL